MSSRMVRVSGAIVLGGVGAVLGQVPYATSNHTLLKASVTLPLFALFLVPIVAGKEDGALTAFAEGAFDGIAASLSHMAGATIATPW